MHTYVIKALYILCTCVFTVCVYCITNFIASLLMNSGYYVFDFITSKQVLINELYTISIWQSHRNLHTLILGLNEVRSSGLSW